MPPLCLVARGGGAFMWAAPRPWGLTRGGQQHAVLPRGPVSSLRQTGVGRRGGGAATAGPVARALLGHGRPTGWRTHRPWLPRARCFGKS